jgi:hypothetical protein
LLWVALAAVTAYLPALAFPFISDDYTQIAWSRVWGGDWNALWAQEGFRFRATYIELCYWFDHWFGFRPFPYYVVSIGLHVVASWLVLLFAKGLGLAPRAAFFAALFFAVHDGHQEAVMWLAAAPELFQFVFGVGALVCWQKWLRGAGAGWYAAALGLFAVSLFSKESAVIGAALALLLLARESAWRRIAFWIPWALMAAFVLAFTLGVRNARLNDGSFDPHAPALWTLLRSMHRLLWPWGWLALFLLWRRPAVRWVLAGMVLALAPYCFLTYLPYVASRHTYLASCGTALLVGMAFVMLPPRRTVLAGAAIGLVCLGVLWFQKRPQFLERAASTDRIVSLARQGHRHLRVRCFPYPRNIAEAAAASAGATVNWDPLPQAPKDCLDVSPE